MLEWRETWRYHAPGKVDEARAEAFLASAVVAADSLTKMRLDGVL